MTYNRQRELMSDLFEEAIRRIVDRDENEAYDSQRQNEIDERLLREENEND